MLCAMGEWKGPIVQKMMMIQKRCCEGGRRIWRECSSTSKVEVGFRRMMKVEDGHIHFRRPRPSSLPHVLSLTGQSPTFNSINKTNQQWVTQPTPSP